MQAPHGGYVRHGVPIGDEAMGRGGDEAMGYRTSGIGHRVSDIGYRLERLEQLEL